MNSTRAVLLLLFSTAAVHAEEAGEGRVFEPRRVVKPFPAIKDPPLIKASAVEDQVSDAELVIALEIGGEARAYPINMLTGPSREIINDVLGGRAIAATW